MNAELPPLVQLAAIVSAGSPEAIEDIGLLASDHTAFRAKHRQWWERLCDDIGVEGDDADAFGAETDDLCLVASYWLVGHDSPHAYGAYIDWNEDAEEIARKLQTVLDVLGYRLDLDEVDVADESDTHAVLVLLAEHLDAHGYALSIIDTDSDSYHLYVIPASDRTRLEALGEALGLDISTPE